MGPPRLRVAAIPCSGTDLFDMDHPNCQPGWAYQAFGSKRLLVCFLRRREHWRGPCEFCICVMCCATKYRREVRLMKFFLVDLLASTKAPVLDGHHHLVYLLCDHNSHDGHAVDVDVLGEQATRPADGWFAEGIDRERAPSHSGGDPRYDRQAKFGISICVLG